MKGRDEMDSKLVGSFIAELRKEKGLTQKQMAEKLSVTDKAVSRWEMGNGYPDIEILISLSEVLGVSLNELLSGKRLEEDERETESQKYIADAYGQAKKAKRRSNRTIILALSAVLVFALLIFGLVRCTLIKHPIIETREATLKTNDTYAVLSELDALIQENVEPTYETVIYHMSLNGRGSEFENLVLQFYDPKYDPEKSQRYEANCYFGKGNDGIELKLIWQERVSDEWKYRIEHFFGIKSTPPEYTPSDGIPYDVCMSIIQNTDFHMLADEYGEGEYESFNARYIGRISLPAEEGTLMERRPKLFYNNGILTEIDNGKIPDGMYDVIEITGMNGGMGEGDDSLYICVK